MAGSGFEGVVESGPVVAAGERGGERLSDSGKHHGRADRGEVFHAFRDRDMAGMGWRGSFGSGLGDCGGRGLPAAHGWICPPWGLARMAGDHADGGLGGDAAGRSAGNVVPGGGVANGRRKEPPVRTALERLADLAVDGRGGGIFSGGTLRLAALARPGCREPLAGKGRAGTWPRDGGRSLRGVAEVAFPAGAGIHLGAGGRQCRDGGGAGAVRAAGCGGNERLGGGSRGDKHRLAGDRLVLAGGRNRRFAGGRGGRAEFHGTGAVRERLDTLGLSCPVADGDRA